MFKKRILSAAVCLLFGSILLYGANIKVTPEKYYIADNKIMEITPALNEASVLHAAERFRFLYDSYLKPNNIRTYIAIIPEKSYYLPDPKGRGQMDYDLLFSMTYENTDFASPIDLTSVLTKDSYYATDAHWRQEALVPVAEHIACSMNAADTSLLSEYQTLPAMEGFVGSYREALSSADSPDLLSDTIYYLTSDALTHATVYYDDTDTTGDLYNWEKLTDRNPYDFFLSGPCALIHIENPKSDSSSRLIVFRDSFGSSLIPLLVPYYKEILVIDIRYTISSRLDEQIDFHSWNEADCLFLYSTLLLNRSMALK